MLQDCCKNAARLASRLAVISKSGPRLLQGLLGSFWNFPVASESLLHINSNCIVLSVFFLLRFWVDLGDLLGPYFSDILVNVRDFVN